MRNMLLLLVAAFVLLACSSADRLPRLSSGGTILAFGDSLTYGTGAGPGESYPAVLANLTGRRVVNAGVPGEVTAEGAARLPEVLEREKPALMILCHGGNDLLRRIDRKETANNLLAMVRIARERGVAVVLVSVPAFDLSLSPPEFYADIARELRIPCEKKVLTRILRKGPLKSDLIHPNSAGYRMFAEALAKLLEKNGAL